MQIKKPATFSTDSLASSVTAAPTVTDQASMYTVDDTSTIAPSASDSDGLSLSLSADPDQKQVLLSIVPPAKPQHAYGANMKYPQGGGMMRAALDVCCVIDVSGSMGSEALIPADPATGAPAESTGLSVLDVVKHALRTIVSTLQPDDRLGIVAFSGSAKVVSPLTAMTEGGRKGILDSVKTLSPTGNTNLWDGLKVGMDLLTENTSAPTPTAPTPIEKTEKSGTQRKSVFTSLWNKKGSSKGKSSTPTPTSGRFTTLFILTDGMPNVNPPRGHIPMLKAYLDKLDNRNPFSISTFGFGYSLDTQLLLEIAQVGGGGYGFIPDSGIVGTVFVHAVANAFTTYAPRARLDVEVPEGTTVQVKGDLPVTPTSWGVQIEVGDVQYGQSLDVVLECEPMNAKDIVATLNYRPVTARVGDDERKVSAAISQGFDDLAAVRYHAARLGFVEALKAVDKTKLGQSITTLKGLAEKITSSPVLGKHADALALAKDISGEGVMALESKNYNKWGRHYLPSLARSHQLQQCGNFKDPGLQVYGRDSALFVAERDKLDAAFMALPPPEPSVPAVPVYNYSGSGSGSVSSAPRVQLKSMSRYYNSSGPCFAGDCVVGMADGGVVRVEELRRGMEVRTLKGTGVVAAVVRTSVSPGGLEMCLVGELKVTPWHPIVSGRSSWVFPADVVKPEMVACDGIYSVLLLPPADGAADADAHSVLVGGVWCVTLGHGLTKTTTAKGEDVRVHEWLGDYEAVLRELSGLSGFHDAAGVVRCVGTKRDGKSGRICGFVGEQEEGSGYVPQAISLGVCV